MRSTFFVMGLHGSAALALLDLSRFDERRGYAVRSIGLFCFTKASQNLTFEKTRGAVKLSVMTPSNLSRISSIK